MKKTLGQFKNALTSTKIYEKMNHDVYVNPNENYQILINILSKAEDIYVAAPWQQHRLHAKQLIISKRQNRISKEYMFIYICTV